MLALVSVLKQRCYSQLRCEFGDADDWHPAANVERMSRGIPLSDEVWEFWGHSATVGYHCLLPSCKDRLPWLQPLHGLLAGWVVTGGCGQGVLACSALRRSYRDILVGRGKGEKDISQYCTFVLLTGSFEVLQVRDSNRRCRTVVKKYHSTLRHYLVRHSMTIHTGTTSYLTINYQSLPRQLQAAGGVRLYTPALILLMAVTPC